MGPWNKVGWWHAPAICGIESRRGDYATGMGGTKASLSPLDSAGHPPSFGILCVGIERVVGVTARSPLACQRPSKPAPMLLPIFQWPPKRCQRGLTLLDATFPFTPSSRYCNFPPQLTCVCGDIPGYDMVSLPTTVEWEEV